MNSVASKFSFFIAASAMVAMTRLAVSAETASNISQIAASPVAEVATSAPAPAPADLAGPFTQENFLAALSRALTSHFNLEGDLSLEMIRPWNTPDRVARDWQVVLSDYPSLPSASMLVRCRVVADGAVVSDTNLVLRAALWREAWIARQPLNNGAAFDPSLLDTRRVDLFRDRDAIPSAVGDRSFIFTRSVQAGRLLTWRDIGRRPLVRKGDLVEVSAAEGMLSITMKALAMQNGAQGEAVTVRNLESKKDFTAFVVDENRVQVRF